jgi:transcriptional repressor NrdR
VICPFCQTNDDKVIDSRPSEAGRVIRRRRECLKCHKRFSTYERVEQTSRLMVVKRDGSREPFDADKILRGVQHAAGKRAIPEEVKARLVDTIDEELHREFDREVPSGIIGDRVGRALLDVDEVAYIRFRSEFLKLTPDQLRAEMKELENRPRDVKHQQSLFVRDAAAPSAGKSEDDLAPELR